MPPPRKRNYCSGELLFQDELAALVRPAHARQERHAEQVDAQAFVGMHDRRTSRTRMSPTSTLRNCTSAALVTPLAVLTRTV